MAAQADWANHLVLTAGPADSRRAARRGPGPGRRPRLRPQPGLLDLSFSTRVTACCWTPFPARQRRPPTLGARITTPRGIVSRSDGSRIWLDRPVSAFQLAHRGIIGQQVWVRTDALEYEFTELVRPPWACDWGWIVTATLPASMWRASGRRAALDSAGAFPDGLALLRA